MGLKQIHDNPRSNEVRIYTMTADKRSDNQPGDTVARVMVKNIKNKKREIIQTGHMWMEIPIKEKGIFLDQIGKEIRIWGKVYYYYHIDGSKDYAITWMGYA